MTVEYISPEDAHERFAEKNAQIEKLANALFLLIGSRDPAELRDMRRVMKAIDCEDSRVGVIAIDALLEHLE